MELTREEERMLNGDYGEATRLAMRLIVRVGEALGAEKLVEISHAHVSGISYDNIGEHGLSFIKELAEKGGRARVYATYNPVGLSLLPGPLGPEEVGEAFYKKQMEIIRSLEHMGFKASATCIPYRLRRPRLGEHLAWGESSAVAVANTLYGARTNREGGPLALAAALTGRTYYWGLHLEENRRPDALVSYTGGPLGEPGSGVLGYIIGQSLPDTVPYIDAAVEKPRGVQSLCAAAAASGNTAMCVIRGVSPEDHGPPERPRERLTITPEDLERLRRDIAPLEPREAELFFTGCPHHGVEELDRIERLLDELGLDRAPKPVWVAVPGLYSASLRERAERLRRRNIHVLPGTCIVVARLIRGARIATDSLKAVFYLPRRHGAEVAVTSLREFLKQSLHG